MAADNGFQDASVKRRLSFYLDRPPAMLRGLNPFQGPIVLGNSVVPTLYSKAGKQSRQLRWVRLGDKKATALKRSLMRKRLADLEDQRGQPADFLVHAPNALHEGKTWR